MADVIIPNAGESVTFANVAQWHVADGASVSKGDILVTLETDKVSSELEAEVSGVLSITVPEGEEVLTSTVIGAIAEGGAVAAAEPEAPEQTVGVATSPLQSQVPHQVRWWMWWFLLLGSP